MRKNNFLDKFKKVTWILTPFILLAIIIILLLRHCDPEECFDCDDLEEKIDNIEDDIKGRDCLDCDWENIDGEEVQKPTENDTIIDGEEVQEPTENDTIIDGEIVQNPTKNCRAHFAGTFLSDEEQSGHISIIYQIDNFSEYVGEGEYPRGQKAFPKADATSFDAIAIDHGTQVIIYSEENFKGKILLNEKGPSIILNIHRNPEYRSDIDKILTKIFKEPLNTNFPPSCRKMSSTNMFEWSKGSLKVICNE